MKDFEVDSSDENSDINRSRPGAPGKQGGPKGAPPPVSPKPASKAPSAP